MQQTKKQLLQLSYIQILNYNPHSNQIQSIPTDCQQTKHIAAQYEWTINKLIRKICKAEGITKHVPKPQRRPSQVAAEEAEMQAKQQQLIQLGLQPLQHESDNQQWIEDEEADSPRAADEKYATNIFDDEHAGTTHSQHSHSHHAQTFNSRQSRSIQSPKSKSRQDSSRSSHHDRHSALDDDDEKYSVAPPFHPPEPHNVPPPQDNEQVEAQVEAQVKAETHDSDNQTQTHNDNQLELSHVKKKPRLRPAYLDHPGFFPCLKQSRSGYTSIIRLNSYTDKDSTNPTLQHLCDKYAFAHNQQHTHSLTTLHYHGFIIYARRMAQTVSWADQLPKR